MGGSYVHGVVEVMYSQLLMGSSDLMVEGVFLTQSSQPEQGGIETSQSLSGDHHPQTPNETKDCRNYFRDTCNRLMWQICRADLCCGESVKDWGVCTSAVLGELGAH